MKCHCNFVCVISTYDLSKIAMDEWNSPKNMYRTTDNVIATEQLSQRRQLRMQVLIIHNMHLHAVKIGKRVRALKDSFHGQQSTQSTLKEFATTLISLTCLHGSNHGLPTTGQH